MKPCLKPQLSSTTFTTGTRQFVVHEAFERTWCFAGSYFWWFTPITIVMSSPLAGAEMTTFFAPAARCLSASGRSVNRPVLSSTRSTPNAFHGSFSGSLIADTLIGLPLTTSASPCASTVPGNRRWMESYFRRCASVLVSVMSFTATNSSACCFMSTAARSTLRPMRPNPLIPTRTAMAVRVGINGFGRIGRNVLRAAVLMKQQALEFVAVNDITDTKTLAHLLKYDSIHRRFPGTVEAQGDALVVNGKPIKVSAIKEPEKLPWKALGVDLVLESTGRFTDRPDADKHLAAGAKKVVISAPAKGEDITIVMGVNHQKYDPAKHHVLSNASCTTNCLVPVVKVVLDNWGFKHGFMTTIHSYTNDQQILDLPHKDLRRARAAALSIIPTTTGAAKATSLVIPEVKGKIDGISLRVPTPDVSVVELTAEVEKKTTIQEVNDAFKQAARSSLQGILDVSDEPLVSVDYIGSFYSSVVDALSTNVIDGTFLHVSSWYDNEMGYSARCVDLLAHLARK